MKGTRLRFPAMQSLRFHTCFGFLIQLFSSDISLTILYRRGHPPLRTIRVNSFFHSKSPVASLGLQVMSLSGRHQDTIVVLRHQWVNHDVRDLGCCTNLNTPSQHQQHPTTPPRLSTASPPRRTSSRPHPSHSQHLPIGAASRSPSGARTEDACREGVRGR